MRGKRRHAENHKALILLAFFGGAAQRRPQAQVSRPARRRPHNSASRGAPRELVEAMRAIATTGVAPADQKALIGCSIKWKDE
jgi:hypothetical protein